MTRYTDSYIESLFEIWYAGGGQEYRIFYDKKIIPQDQEGRIPSYQQFINWANEYRWQERKDALDARALEKAEENLINKQVAMWKEHADAAAKIRKEALAYIEEHGFDSSTSAIQAIKWAQEEERKTRGAEAFIESVKNKSNDELISMIRGLAERQLSTEDIIEAEQEDAEPSN